MSKLTDIEIVKALECCANDDSCENCPLMGRKLGKGCLPVKGFYNQIVDLLNRNEEMINGLIAGQETLQKGMAERDKEIERLHKLQNPTGAGGYKIENGKVIFYSDMLNGYRHEYKDLEEIVKELNLYMHTDYKNIELISHYKHKAQTAKTEARKEFAEKLEDLSTEQQIFVGFGETKLENIILYADVDNLLKEMEGETNGKQ